MRRYVLYVAVVLLTFGIGVLTASKFYLITTEKTVITEEIKIISETQPERTLGLGYGSGDGRWNEAAYVPKLHKATCSDKKLLPIWTELRKDKEFKEREKVFYQEADCSNSIEIQKVDLNSDGQTEFVVWGRYNFSSATGNCVIWIYEKKNGKYKQLLQSYAYYGESKWFEVKKNKAKGYRNLLLKGHFTAAETTYHFYKFNGRKYVESNCLFEIYSMDEEMPSMMTCKEYDIRTEKELRESQALLENQ